MCIKKVRIGSDDASATVGGGFPKPAERPRVFREIYPLSETRARCFSKIIHIRVQGNVDLPPLSTDTHGKVPHKRAHCCVFQSHSHIYNNRAVSRISSHLSVPSAHVKVKQTLVKMTKTCLLSSAAAVLVFYALGELAFSKSRGGLPDLLDLLESDAEWQHSRLKYVYGKATGADVMLAGVFKFINISWRLDEIFAAQSGFLDFIMPKTVVFAF